MSDQGPPPPGHSVPPPPQPGWFGPQDPSYPPPPPGYAPPPPGYAPPPPGYAPPGYYPPPPGYYAPPPMLPAAHKPGALPLRPLNLGDIFDAAFKIIRFNPGATVGSSVLVTAVAMAIPVALTGVLVSLIDFSSTSLGDSNGSGSNNVVGIGSILQLIGLVFVTGMITHVVSAAAVGARLTLSQAWAATRGKRWKLIGMTALLYGAILLYLAAVVLLIVLVAYTLPLTAAVILGVLLGVLGVVGLAFFWIRVYYLAVPPLMLEDVGVFGALGRSWRLTSRQFWRIFGIDVLTTIITNIASSLLGLPFIIIGVVIAFGASDGSGDSALLVLVITNAVATVASSAFVAPFAASVTSIQYIDQRIRKEGYDVELLTRAGITGP